MAAAAALANAGTGIYVGNQGATIGGTSTSTANIISGNGYFGIEVEASCVVEGNLIGINESGTAAVANADNGIYVGTSGVTIGGSTPGAGNVISGNGQGGVDAEGSSCLVESNLIGTDETGANPVPN